MAGEGLGAAIGAGVGHLVGAGGIGALIGEHALGPFISSILPAITKPLLSSEASGPGLKTAIEYGLQVAKGEALVTKAAKNVFKSGAEVIPMRQVAENDREKLDKRLQELQTNPESLLAVGGDVGHYLPEHNSAMGETAMRSVQYLNSLRPNTQRRAPLDQEPKPSQMQNAPYKRALNIAIQPLSVMTHIKEGTLIPQDVVSLKTMYPALYPKLAQNLTNSMINHVSDGGTVPYKTRMPLSIFLGEPLDSSLTASSISSAQAIFAIQKGNKMADAMEKPKSNTKALKDSSNPYQTSGQATAMRQQQG